MDQQIANMSAMPISPLRSSSAAHAPSASEDVTMADAVDDSDDPFDEFDLPSDEEARAFFKAALAHAPKEEALGFHRARTASEVVEIKPKNAPVSNPTSKSALRKVRRDTKRALAAAKAAGTARSMPASASTDEAENVATGDVLEAQVAAFRTKHAFMISTKGFAAPPDVRQRRRFTRDIYDYARARGMATKDARKEVRKARFIWRQERHLEGSQEEVDESDEDSDFAGESSLPVRTTVKAASSSSGSQVKSKGRSDGVQPTASSKKRKRGTGATAGNKGHTMGNAEKAAADIAGTPSSEQSFQSVPTEQPISGQSPPGGKGLESQGSTVLPKSVAVDHSHVSKETTDMSPHSKRAKHDNRANANHPKEKPIPQKKLSEEERKAKTAEKKERLKRQKAEAVTKAHAETPSKSQGEETTKPLKTLPARAAVPNGAVVKVSVTPSNSTEGEKDSSPGQPATTNTATVNGSAKTASTVAPSEAEKLTHDTAPQETKHQRKRKRKAKAAEEANDIKKNNQGKDGDAQNHQQVNAAQITPTILSASPTVALTDAPQVKQAGEVSSPGNKQGAPGGIQRVDGPPKKKIKGPSAFDSIVAELKAGESPKPKVSGSAPDSRGPESADKIISVQNESQLMAPAPAVKPALDFSSAGNVSTIQPKLTARQRRKQNKTDAVHEVPLEPKNDEEAHDNYIKSNVDQKVVVGKDQQVLGGPSAIRDSRGKASGQELSMENLRDTVKFNQQAEAQSFENSDLRHATKEEKKALQDAKVTTDIAKEKGILLDDVDQGTKKATQLKAALHNDAEIAKEQGTFNQQTGKTKPQLAREAREKAIMEENGVAKPLSEVTLPNGKDTKGKRRSLSKSNKDV